MKIKAGQKFVSPGIEAPPIYIRISEVRRHGGRVIAECWQGDKHMQRRSFPIPLPATWREENWKFEEIK